MKKLVDGKLVDMTPAEIAERQAEEAAWEAGKVEREKLEKDKKDRDTALDAIDYTKKLTEDEIDLVCRYVLAARKGK
jgi:hypothetical protein